MSLFTRLYRALLSRAPLEFRITYGDDAVALAESRVADEPSRFRRARRMATELLDVALTAGRERQRTQISASRPKGLAMDALFRDLRLAARTLRRAPAFSALATLMLAAGIGGSAVMFTIVRTAVLQRMPFTDSERLVRVWQVSDRNPRVRIAHRTWLDWRERSSAFATLAAAAPSGLVGVQLGGEPERVLRTSVSGNFFTALGIAPTAGRTFAGAELAPGGPAAAMIGEALWTRAFGRDPAVLSRTLLIDGEPFAIVGVVPREVSYPAGTEIWTTFERFEVAASRNAHNFEVIGRLEAAVPITQAQSEIATVTAALHAIDPAMAREGHRVRVVSLREDLLDGSAQTISLMLGAVLIVLVIGCANVVNLLLARATSRQAQMTLRLAIGAPRSALVRLCVAEAMMLALAGGAGGALLTLWLTGAATALVPAALVPDGEVRAGAWTYGAIVVLAVLSGLACGLAAAVHTLRTTTAGAHAGGARSTETEPPAMRGLVVLEVALAVMVVAGAALLVRSLQNLERVDPGFARTGVYLASINLGGGSASPYREPAARAAFLDRLLDDLRAIGGVEAAGLTSSFPFSFSPNAVLEQEGVAPDLTGGGISVHYRVIGGSYFHALSTRMVAGRAFTDGDRVGAPMVAIVSETAAQAFGGAHQALGVRVRMRNIDGIEAYAPIVGVVADIRHRGISVAAQPEVYFPYAQRPFRTFAMTLVVRSALPQPAVAMPIRQTVRRLDPAIPVSLDQIETRLALQVAAPRFRARLMLLFGAAATLLAVGGIVGVVSYGVSRRIKEIGIRVALGADAVAVRRLVLRHALAPVVAGAILGAVGSVAARGLVANLLFGVAPADPATIVGAAVLLVAAAAAGALWPAARASRIDPLTALRRL